MPLRPDATVVNLNRRTGDNLPGWFGFEVVGVSEGRLAMEVVVKPVFLAPNGFLHAATVIALADTASGYATIAHLPDGASNFTTIELKANFLGTATDGTLRADASAAHQGRTTQVWDATVTHVDSGKTIALFRCTQMILWPKK
ncbi:MAG: PaaI family thioesterase [Pseudomonadota bacterium]|nr:PaaI family thioesterase [Burkholderiaceae bacterium]MDQ3447116.1 PaaI family thioesterase [Pseudomonadota bacterium]